MQPGDRVRRQATGEEGVILRAAGDFFEVAFASGRVLVHPDELEALPEGPAERLAVGELGHGLPYVLRLQALYLKHAYKYDALSGLSNARIEPTLHQVYIAHIVAQKLKPRMILADEVGLGKTIEAGLIIKELRARGLLERVLVICPASLQLQWQTELRSKFNEDFQIIDGAAARFLGRDGTNPWLKPQNVICSLPFATHSKNAERIADAEWDMVVFDEAHRVRRRLEGWNRYRTTQAYRLADDLKDLVNGLLLLTATPMQLHPSELYSLIELVEPGLYPTPTHYERKRRDLPKLNDLMKSLKGWATLGADERAAVVARHSTLLNKVAVKGKNALEVLDDEEQRSAVMDLIVEQHPLAGVLVRNRKAEIGGFTKREAHRFLVNLTEEELQLYSDVTKYLRNAYSKARAAKNLAVGFVMVIYQKMLTSSSYAIRQSLKRRVEKLRDELRRARETKLSPDDLEDLRDAEEESSALAETEGIFLDREALEWEITSLEELIQRLGKARDSKAAELIRLLRPIFDSGAGEKVLIFTQFIETQHFLQDVLENQGYRTVIFNGQMKLDDKEDAVDKFRREAQILISTEAGGEGRNFQFCHIMVNYDLPWNPMKVEQRIGRLDRIGQRKTVFIHNLVCAQTVEERVLQVLEHRIGLFEESVGSLDPILGEVERDIERIVMEQGERLADGFEAFEKEIERLVREAKERERTLADFVLDRASLRRDLADQLLDRIPLARYTDLQQFVGAALAYYGGSLNEHPEGGHVISLSPKLQAQLGVKKGVVRGCFDWRQAQELEHLDFFAFGHELIDKIVELPLRLQPSVTGARRAVGGPRGVRLEVLYQIRAEGAHPSGKVIRHVVEATLNVHSEELNHPPAAENPIDGLKVPTWAADAVRVSGRLFQTQLAGEREHLRREYEGVREDELARAERIFQYREVRLKKLIEEQTLWIDEREESGTERDRRVLPARRGRLTKDKERLERLRFEYDVQVADIRKREPAVGAEVLAAGLAVDE